MRTALAVGAHPDDIEISCSGTLNLLGRLGLELHVATMTLGDCGSQELSPKQIAAQRQSEAESACALLGACYHYAGSSDFCIFNDDAHNRRVTSLLRTVRPDLVLTHSPGDYMLDHETTSTLVRNACFYAPVPNYDTSHISSWGAISHVPHLYYFDVMEGVDILGKPVVPEFYVDITDLIDFKLTVLAEHKSQRYWLGAQHGIEDYLLTTRSWAHARGTEVSRPDRRVNYAEAFRQHRGHAYPSNNLLQELLGESLILNPSY